MSQQVQSSSYPIGGPPGVPPPSAINATATSNTSSPLPSAQQPTQAQPQQGTVPQFPPGVKVAAGSETQAQTQQSQPQPQQPMAQPAQQLPPGVLAAAAGHRPPSAVPTPGMTPDRIPPRSSSTAFPAGLSDLVASFESVKQKGVWFYPLFSPECMLIYASFRRFRWVCCMVGVVQPPIG